MFFARDEIPFPPELEQALRPSLAPASLKPLWEKLAKGRGQISEGEKHYSFSRAEAESYAAYYLPANALKTALILEESFLLDQNLIGDSAHWLDFGTGPGTAYWGLAWWCAQRNQKLRFSGWDQSPLFTDIATRLTNRSPFPVRAQFLAGGREDPIQLTRRLAPTHLSFVNSVAEIYPSPAKRLEACRALLRTLQELSRTDGRPRYLLLVEPGSRESSRELAALKDALGFPVLLPCLDSRPCGALVNPKDWCHEEVACRFPSWLNEMGETAGLRKESMLFSYALIQAHPEQSPPTHGDWRVVSQRLERKGQVECWNCAPHGKIFARAQRSKAANSPAADLILKAARGDIWEGAALGEKGDIEAGTLKTPSRKSIFG